MVVRTGEDKEAVMRSIVAGDLADSDDEDLNEYGQGVKAGLARVDKFGGDSGKAESVVCVGGYSCTHHRVGLAVGSFGVDRFPFPRQIC